MITTVDRPPYYPCADAVQRNKGTTDGWEWWVAPWLAGLVDGEGAVMLSRRGNGGGRAARYPSNGWRPRICVYNTDYRLVDAVKTAVGFGRIACCRRDRVKETHKKDSYYWVVEGSGMRAVAEKILPFSVIKREQLAAVIEVRVAIESRPFDNHGRVPLDDERMLELYNVVRRLNSKGRKGEV